MQINYNKHIIFDPKVEDKTKEHYSFIKKHFCDAYISEEDFLNRKDLFIIVIRNANHIIVAACLVKDYIEEDRIRIKYPSSFIPYSKRAHTPYIPYWDCINLSKPPPDISPTITTKEKIKSIITPKKQKSFRFDDLDTQCKINTCHVYRVIFTLVDQYYRGKGYNQILLDFVYEKAIEHGNTKKILASIRESNIPSLKSFERNGYKISGLRSTPYKNGEKKIRVYKFVFKKVNIKIPQQPENQHSDVPCS